MPNRHVLLIIFSIFVVMTTSCQNVFGRQSSMPVSPETDVTPTQALQPTFTEPAQANAGQSNTETDGGTEAYMPLVGSGDDPTATSSPEPTLTPAPAPTNTPADTETSGDGDNEDNEPEPMDLRDDLPALSLQDWPRPAGDNGRCMHFVRDQYFSEQELDTNIARLQQLNAKWVLVLYADENILQMAASKFANSGITPVWRKMVRPHEAYYNWERDIELVESYGLPPYFQVYNEPSLRQEWKDAGGKPNKDEAIDHIMQATRDVYNAGGYVGWQFIDPDWLRDALDELEARQGTQVLERFFFVPHPYGLNHPPGYTQDINSVLGFRVFADVFRERYGFVPPMIAGEGGWKINNEADPRYPKINDELHRDYHVEVFRWFQTGTLSDGQPLPDYLFAYCPWLIAAKMDDNAWWDSFAGDRELTIEAVSNLPPFVRTFSWEQ